MAQIDEVVISPLIANHVLWFFGRDEGFAPGGFFAAFYELASRADKDNLAKLELGFPAQIAAFELARNNPDGLQQLRAIATTLRLVSS